MTPIKNSRSEQARINGSKSKGPVSVEGKAASSRNALKHGFAAAINVVIEIEDRPAWETHLEGYRASFKPQCYAEQTMVDQLASINWRQSRLVALETSLIDAQISIQSANVNDMHPRSADDPYFHLVQAWQALSREPEKQNEPKDPAMPPNGYDINSMELLRRYMVSLDRQYRNVLLNLRQFRKDFAAAPPPAPDPVPAPPNEPKPPQTSPRTNPSPATLEQPTTPLRGTQTSKTTTELHNPGPSR
jgi:hypothetical protein